MVVETVWDPKANAYVPKKKKACCDNCAEGKPCAGCGTQPSGLGAIWPGYAALDAQFQWLGQVWRVVDAGGRSWDQALSDARARAAAGNWTAGDAVARSDLIALAVSSVSLARAVSNLPNIGAEASDALNSTWVILAKKAGYNGQNADDIKTAASKDTSPAGMAIIELVLLIALAALVAAVYAYAIYRASVIVDNLLARNAADKELLRLHAEWDKIVEKHMKDGTPFSDQELDILHQLEAAQGKLATIVAPGGSASPAAGFWDSPWAWAGVAGIVGLTVVAVVYREEIKDALVPRRRRLAA